MNTEPGGRATSDTLKVAQVSRTYYYVPLWSSQQEGFFGEEGITVDVEVLDSTGRVNRGLLDKSFQIGIGTPEGVVNNVESGSGQLAIAAGNANKLTHSLIALEQFREISDLRGARIGVASLDEGTAFVIQDMLQQHGLSYPDDYEMVDAGGVPSRWKKLQEGLIDAGLQSIPFNYAAMDAGFPNLGDSWDYVPDYQFTTVNVNRDWADANEEALRAFLRGLQRGTSWMYANEDDAVALIVRELGVSEEYAKRGWKHYTSLEILPESMEVSEPGMRTVLRIMNSAGNFDHSPQDVDLSRYVEHKWLDG